ncbi:MULTISPECIES: twin-arginine translocase TatA/TatE family subunit [Myroides]|uniref:Sec-independent protein translocase subunit TatA/TatB n=1 Tax=Myroides TaxID=76831 RepID=UPI0013031049|nr:twin-arginine translocase TatA/TatE family subunit [Myroides phaeus]
MITTNIPLGVVAPSELIVVVAIALLLFGGKKIPELMRGLGTGIREFKEATREVNTATPVKTQPTVVKQESVDNNIPQS